MIKLFYKPLGWWSGCWAASWPGRSSTKGAGQRRKPVDRWDATMDKPDRHDV
jgi:hypothetical protein